MIIHFRLARIAMVMITAIAVSCGVSDISKSNGSQKEVKTLPMTDELRPLMAWADSADGATDSTIARCVMCKYVCIGQVEHGSMVGSYKVLACSHMDKENFEKDPIAALTILRASK